MNKNKRRINKIRSIINRLNPDYYYILYFEYDLKKNFLHSPLLIFTKLLSLITRKKAIDHICHISRFVKDGKKQNAKIFEATIKLGMRQYDLADKLQAVKGKVYIEKLCKVNKKKAQAFEDEYYGIEYSEFNALAAGIDWLIFDKLFETRKKDGLFCSWLEAISIRNQGINIPMPLDEYTPADIYHMNFAKKNLFYDSKEFD